MAKATKSERQAPSCRLYFSTGVKKKERDAEKEEEEEAKLEGKMQRQKQKQRQRQEQQTVPGAESKQAKNGSALNDFETRT